MFQTETSLLFNRIRSERNQSSSGGGGAEGNQPRSSSTSSSVLSGATNSGTSAQISSVSADREAFSRWRDRQYYGPRRWLNKEDYVWDKDSGMKIYFNYWNSSADTFFFCIDNKKKEPTSLSSPIWISEDLQPWPDRNNSIRFKKIGALYSEFIGLSENGELHQWRWMDVEPFKSEVCKNCRILISSSFLIDIPKNFRSIMFITQKQ